MPWQMTTAADAVRLPKILLRRLPSLAPTLRMRFSKIGFHGTLERWFLGLMIANQ